jgi:hypothetical protein
VRESEDAVDIANYIVHNPERKGLVVDPGDYRWSGTPDPM